MMSLILLDFKILIILFQTANFNLKKSKYSITIDIKT